MSNWVPGTVPDHIVSQWRTARKFKAAKRDILRRVIREWEDFRLGIAYAPCGTKSVMEVDELLRKIKAEISEAKWGR